MTLRRRNALIGIVVALVALEVVLQVTGGSAANLRIVNDGASPMENIRVSHDGRESRVDRIGPGESADVSVAGSKADAMIVAFQQKGNSLSAIEIEEFDPGDLRRRGQRFEIVVKEVGYQRYEEDDPHWTTRSWQRFRDWLSEP